MSTIDPQAIEDLREQQRRIEDDDRKASEYLDRVALIGGSAAILASLSFLKDIAPDPRPGSIWVLIASWILLLLGALAGLLSLVTTRLAAQAYCRLLKRKIEERNPVIKPNEFAEVRRPNTYTRIANRSALVMFLLGAVALVSFAIINLPRKKEPATRKVVSPIIMVDDSAAAKIFRDCVRSQCVILYGYEYNFEKAPPIQSE